MKIDVINIYIEKPQDYIYIGRDSHDPAHHYGNPFTHLWGHTRATVKVGTREDAMQAYEDWLRGNKWSEVEPFRRRWILEQIDRFARGSSDLTFGCFCKPKQCHGDVLAKLIEEAKAEILRF